MNVLVLSRAAFHVDLGCLNTAHDNKSAAILLSFGVPESPNVGIICAEYPF